MPAPLAVDREQVRIVALAVGVREAARQYELPEATVQAWSARYGWFAKEEAVATVQEAAKERVRERQGLQPAATKSAAEVLKAYDGETRFSLAKGIAAGARAVSEMDGQEVLMSAPLVSQLAKSAAVVHGWTGNSAQVSIRLDVLASDSSSPVIDV